MPTRRPIDADVIRKAARVGALALVVATAQASGATLSVGAGRSITTIAEAARVARDGDVIEITAGDYRGDVYGVEVIAANNLTIRVGLFSLAHRDDSTATSQCSQACLAILGLSRTVKVDARYTRSCS